jgi:hypothetical protein
MGQMCVIAYIGSIRTINLTNTQHGISSVEELTLVPSGLMVSSSFSGHDGEVIGTRVRRMMKIHRVVSTSGLNEKLPSIKIQWRKIPNKTWSQLLDATEGFSFNQS